VRLEFFGNFPEDDHADDHAGNKCEKKIIKHENKKNDRSSFSINLADTSYTGLKISATKNRRNGG